MYADDFQYISKVELEGLDLVVIEYNLKADAPAGKLDMVKALMSFPPLCTLATTLCNAFVTLSSLYFRYYTPHHTSIPWTIVLHPRNPLLL